MYRLSCPGELNVNEMESDSRKAGSYPQRKRMSAPPPPPRTPVPRPCFMVIFGAPALLIKLKVLCHLAVCLDCRPIAAVSGPSSLVTAASFHWPSDMEHRVFCVRCRSCVTQLYVSLYLT